MKTLPLRLPPESDIRVALEQAVASRSCNAAFVLSGIGNLRLTRLRRAGVTEVNAGFAELVVRGASHKDD